MSDYATFDPTLETDEQKERRLAREVRERIGSLNHPDIPAKTGYSVKVEVTYQQDERAPERAGHFAVMLPIDVDPWDGAHDLVIEELQRRYPEAAYTSVDDITSW